MHGPADRASSRHTTRRADAPLGALVLVGLLVLACGSSTPPPADPTADRTPAPPSPSASASPSPASPPATATPSRPPSPSPTAAAVDLSFSSTVYPYTIVLPAAGFTPGTINLVPPPGTWRQAAHAWDGTTVISPSQPTANDSTVDSEGQELFVVGHATRDDLAAFTARLVADFASWHGCSQAPASRAIEVDGVPGVLIASQCSQGAGSANAARMFVVHEGFGLIFNLRTFASIEPEAHMDRLARYVADVDLIP